MGDIGGPVSACVSRSLRKVWTGRSARAPRDRLFRNLTSRLPAMHLLLGLGRHSVCPSVSRPHASWVRPSPRLGATGWGRPSRRRESGPACPLCARGSAWLSCVADLGALSPTNTHPCSGGPGSGIGPSHPCRPHRSRRSSSCPSIAPSSA